VTRLAVFSPLPPAPTGIADYTIDVLHALGDSYDVDVVHDQERVDADRLPARVRAVRASDFDATGYDLPVYQMGNGTAHAYQYDFLARHPKAELYAGFGDFAFWRMRVASAHLNGGFARAADLKAQDVLTDISGADEMIAGEEGAVAHMNEDHADAILLYATKLLGEDDGPWRISGLDPEGADLAAGDRTARLAFPARVTSRVGIREMLVALVKDARAK